MIESRVRRTITAQTWEQVKTAYAAGIGLREIARNMEIPAGTVLVKAKRAGWTQQILNAKRAANAQVLAVTPMQSAAMSMQQRAERHVERMAGVSQSLIYL